MNPTEPRDDVVKEGRELPPLLQTIRFCSTCGRGDLGNRDHHYSGGRRCEGGAKTITYIDRNRVIATIKAQADDSDNKGNTVAGVALRELAKQIKETRP